MRLGRTKRRVLRTGAGPAALATAVALGLAALPWSPPRPASVSLVPAAARTVGAVADGPPRGDRPAPAAGGAAGAFSFRLGWPFREAWVAVPVATIWNHPGTARPEDSLAVSSRSDVARWLAALGYQQKLGLDDLLATQALLDQPVVVFGHKSGWDHVIVLGQTGAVFPFGIAGWVPHEQLTLAAPPRTPVRATVDVPVLQVGGMALSYGTQLPVVAAAGGRVTVVMPKGGFQVPAGALRTTSLPRSGNAVVAEAERFLGLPYLWAGTSAFGYDCSGLTYSVYQRFGIVLARDAEDQARGGAPVARHDLRPGDLVFFSFGGTVDHVGIYAGNGMMVDSPQTGAAIEVVPLWGTSLSRYYAGARRYV